MIKLILRIIINSFSIWIASLIVDGVRLNAEASFLQILLLGLVFGLINAFIKPFLKLISAPIIILTLGLFTLLINAFLLWVTSLLLDVLTVDGFWAAFWGAIIISLVSWVFGLILDD